MQIRLSTKHDNKKVAKYLINYWRERRMNFTLKWALEYLKNGMASEFKEERFICIDKGKLLGTIALLKYYENVAEIRDEIWADEEIGSKLISSVINSAKKNKFRKIYSLALKDKVGFYKKHGFSKEGLLKNHFKTGEDIAVMSRFL